MNAMSHGLHIEKEVTGSELAVLIRTMRKAKGGRVDIRTTRGRRFVQDAMYLLASLGNETAGRYWFKEYRNGPYSTDLYDDMKTLTASELRSVVADDRLLSCYPLWSKVISEGEGFIHELAIVHSIWTISADQSMEEMTEIVERLFPEVIPRFDAILQFLEVTGWPRTYI